MKTYSRRQFLEIGGALGTASLLPMAAFGTSPADTIRDRLWIWGHIEGSYDNSYGLPMNSPMTPLQGAAYLDIPNIIMVRYEGKPKPPFDEYAAQYRNVKKLMWSFVGAGGKTSAAEQEHVLALAQKMPNIAGLFMDDFFHGDARPVAVSPPPENLLRDASLAEPEPAASVTVAQLREIRQRMNQLERKINLGVTLYAHQLNPAIRHPLNLCDVVSFWSWTADDLAKLPENFAKYQEIVPNKRTLLGIYMWDFGLSKPLPMDLMKMQCDTALKWLKDGTIEGMIFLASNICDMKIEAVEWSKRWIAEHGRTLIGQG